jgi:hypothetical protein
MTKPNSNRKFAKVEQGILKRCEKALKKHCHAIEFADSQKHWILQASVEILSEKNHLACWLKPCRD